MPRRCAFGCRYDPKIPRHNFPHQKRNPKGLEAWVRILGGKLKSPEDYEFYKKKEVCDVHFIDTDKNRNSRLNCLAVPSLHLTGYSPELNSQKPSEPEKVSLKTVSPKPKLLVSKSEPDVGFLPEVLDTDDSNSNEELLNTSPQTSEEYSAKFHECVAKSFQNIAISGLGQESRQELIKKHPVPYNCTAISAPSLTPEIKATIPEEVIKLDEAIEANQKQLAAAITSLGKVISKQLSNSVRNNNNSDLVKELMATGHLLCDLQYLQSLTRYNNMSLPRS